MFARRHEANRQNQPKKQSQSCALTAAQAPWSSPDSPRKYFCDRSPVCLPRGARQRSEVVPANREVLKLGSTRRHQAGASVASPAAAVEDRNTNTHLSCLDQTRSSPMLRFDFTSQDYLRDPAPALARLRAAGPVVEVRFPIIGRTWIAS
jgi:hypothetical protein